MSRRDWVVELVASVAGVDKPTASSVVERLMEEGLLTLGYGDTEVEKIVETFSQVFGTTKISRQDRYAAHRLAKKYTAQAVCGIISILGQLREERFAPTVGNVAELEEKWVKVENFVRRTYQTNMKNQPVDV